MLGATWIDLLDPSEDELRRRAPRSLHPTALEQLLAPVKHGDEPRPTLEGHGDYVFGVLLVAVAVPDEDRVFYQEVDVVLTEDTVLTVRKTPQDDPPFDPSATREACPEGSATPAGMILYHLVDEVAEGFLDLLDDLNDEIDELEDHVEEWPTKQIRQRLSDLRHDILRIRRTLNPTRDAVHKIVDDRVDIEGGGLFPRDVELHFGDAYDKLLRSQEALELSRDLVAGVRDYHQAKVANDQNEVMKRLTVIASILLVPTFIVGLYGQNFHHIPELGWGFGYWWSWGWILATTVLQLVFFRWKRWI
jgi:magnesium transporter